MSLVAQQDTCNSWMAIRQPALPCLPDIVFAIQTEADLLQYESDFLCLSHGTKGFLHAYKVFLSRSNSTTREVWISLSNRA